MQPLFVANDGMQPLGDGVPQAKRRRLALWQPALKIGNPKAKKGKPKAKAKPGKPKATAKTVKPKAKPKTAKPKPKAKATTNRSPMPSQPPARKFKPIHFGPCTIYHGGKQRKYRLKESYASRRTTSFNDWAKMMEHIQTL